MSRSRWYEQRKSRSWNQIDAEWRARRDDWRTWAPMAIPNRKKRKGKRGRLEHYLYLLAQSEREVTRPQDGAATYGRPWGYGASVSPGEQRVAYGGNVTIGRWPAFGALTKSGCCP